MIKLEHTEVFNMAAAVRGMRNPMQSWDQSDSYTSAKGVFHLGDKDRELAQRLVKAGSDERKFMRQIFVSVDITAPLYWWKEYDTYKVGTVANSTSTMHKIHAKPFSRDDFSCERMTGDALVLLTEHVIPFLEDTRQWYNTEKNPDYWNDMIQLLPMSYNQTRTCTLNYENLLNQYHARKAHKLEEWRVYCRWAYCLPEFRDICGL